jgi:hypothetical protein
MRGRKGLIIVRRASEEFEEATVANRSGDQRIL